MVVPVNEPKTTVTTGYRTGMTLRSLQPLDRDAFLHTIETSREHLRLFCPLHRPNETDQELFERQLAYAIQAERTGRAWRRVLVDHDGAIVGACNLNTIRRGLENSAEANWWIGAEHVGRGYGSHLLETAVATAFATLPMGLGLDVVRAYITPDNERSTHLANKFGFIRTSNGLTAELRINNELVWHDVYERYVGVRQSADVVRTAELNGLQQLLQIEEHASRA